MKRIHTAANLAEASLLQHILQDAGIAVHVLNTHAVGALGEIPFADAGPQLWITQPQQETYARSLIAEFHKRDHTGVERKCPACGEANPPEFDSCWNCAAVLPTL